MSDYMNDQNVPQTENSQQTRVMPPVEGAPAAAPVVRHRRSDRYRAATEAAVEQTAPAAAEPNEPVSRMQTTRYGMQPPQHQEPVSQSVPRPAVLNRAQEQNAVRRPVPAPGYSQRQPLGQEQPRVRRPVNMEEPEITYEEEKPAKKKKGNALLTTLIVIVLVLGLIVLGFLLIPEDDSTLGQMKTNVVNTLSGVLGNDEDKPTVSDAAAMDFSAAPTQGNAPLEVVFTLTTTKSVSGVRVVDAEGNPLSTSTSVAMDNADSRIWMLNLALYEGYTGLVQAQILDGENWLDTGKTQQLDIAAPQQSGDASAFAAFETTPTPVPTDEPTPVPTEEPTAEPIVEVTDEPTEEPSPEPTEVPTQEPVATPTIEVTATPTLVPTEEPTPEPTAEPTEVPTAEPTVGPTETPALVAQAAEGAEPSIITSSVVYNGASKVDNYDRAVEDIVKMPVTGRYTTLPYGVVTYRGDAFRQNAAVGNVEDISTMSLKWTAEAGSVKGASSTYYGIGWTGQPAIIKWSKEVRQATNINEEKINTTALKEVIIAGMDGKIYFLDLADGAATREAINVGFPMKGTPSIHPLGYPIMSVGQYARKMAKTTGDIGLRFYDLLTQKEVYMIDGLDGKLDRPYYAVGAFDTSALIDPVSDTLITAGTNGMVYLTKLNTEFDYNAGTIDIDPDSIVLKTKAKNQDKKNVAVEASVAAYGNYLFYADMSGILRCVDTSSLTTVWAVQTGDAVQASVALDFDAEGELWVYTANTLQNRKKGDVSIRRYNAMTGEEDWTLAVGSRKNGKNDKITGAMASPVIGQNELSELAIFTLSNLSKDGAQAIFGDSAEAIDGAILAVNKNSGEVVWAQQLDSYSYSSPVAVYNQAGQGWIIQASGAGTLYLMDGLTGEVLNTLQVEGAIEGSPAVYGSTLVIGTTGKNTSFIYGISLE